MPRDRDDALETGRAMEWDDLVGILRDSSPFEPVSVDWAGGRFSGPQPCSRDARPEPPLRVWAGSPRFAALGGCLPQR